MEQLPVEKSPNADNFALIWGAERIAEELGLKPRQAFYMLENGQLPARKVGGRWVAERAKLRAFFLAEEEAA